MQVKRTCIFIRKTTCCNKTYYNVSEVRLIESDMIPCLLRIRLHVRGADKKQTHSNVQGARQISRALLPSATMWVSILDACFSKSVAMFPILICCKREITLGCYDNMHWKPRYIICMAIRTVKTNPSAHEYN